MEQNNVDNKNINPLENDLINSNDSQSKKNNPEDASNSIEKSTESDKSNESRENEEGNESNNNCNERVEEGNLCTEGKKENIKLKDVANNENNNMKDVDYEKKLNNIGENLINKDEDIILEIRKKVNGNGDTNQKQNKNSTTEGEEQKDDILIKEGYDNKSNKSNDQLIIDNESTEVEQNQNKNKDKDKEKDISEKMGIVEEKQHTEKINLCKVGLEDEGESEEKDKEIKQNKVKLLTEVKQIVEIKQSNNLIDNNSLITTTNEEEEEDDKEGSDNSFSNLITNNNEYFPKGIKNLGLNCYMDSLLHHFSFLPFYLSSTRPSNAHISSLPTLLA